MNIAVIPARGGSKRIPRKNIRSFNGKPMIAWSIEAAIDSELFDRVIVSTDDEEIAEVARRFGAEVPFMRPAVLADDFATTMEVMSHALNALAANNVIETACCIYATAPFLAKDDLKDAYNQLIGRQLDYVFAASRFDFPIQRALMVGTDDHVRMIQPEYAQTRSQDLPEAIHDAGQFCWGRTISFTQNISPFAGSSGVLLIPKHRVQDIDTLEDWHRAELMFKALADAG